MGIFSGFSRVFKPFVNTAKKIVKRVESAPEIIEDVKDKAVDVVKNVVDEGKKIGEKIYDALPTELQDGLKSVVNNLEEVAKQSVLDAIDELPEPLRGPAVSLIVQFKNVLFGNVKINDKLTYFNSVDRELASFAKNIYKSTQSKQIGSYTLDEEISISSKYGVWVNNETKVVINAIRGTNPTSVSDLLADISIVAGKEMSNSQFRLVFDKWSDVVKKYPLEQYKHRMTGHSLGGGQIYFLLFTQRDVPNDRVVCFNPGVGSSKDYIDFIKQCERGSRLCDNLATYKIMGDPISLLACLGKLNLTKAVSSNPIANHSMDNF